MLLKLAWRNLWRNKRRSYITMGSIVFAVLLSILLDSVKKGLLDKMKQNVVGFYTGYAQLHGEGYWEEKVLDNSFEHSDSLISQLLSYSEISYAVPRLESFILAASDNYSRGSMVVGIDPLGEDEVTSIHSKLVEGSYFSDNESAALLTEGLANYLKLKVSDTLVLIGQGYHGVSAVGKYPIKGLVKFGSPELNRGLIYLPLSKAQELFGAENRVTSLVLSLANPENAQEIADEINENLTPKYQVLHWRIMLPELDQFIQGEEAENVIFQIVLYLMITFGIFGTILMMTIERKYEFGVLVAIGMRRSLLSAVVVLENILLALCGAMVGILISIPIVYYLYKYPIPLRGQLAEAYESFGIEPIFYFSIDAVVFYTQGIVVMLLAMLLAFYPIVKINGLDPVSAMRS